MARYTYERLSAQDNSFLMVESPKTHMHVASTLIYDAGPLRTEDGGIDFERIKTATEACLHRIPRYRQKLHFIPLEGCMTRLRLRRRSNRERSCHPNG